MDNERVDLLRIIDLEVPVPQTHAPAFPSEHPRTVEVQGVLLTLVDPVHHEGEWIDYNDYLLQMRAAWFRASQVELTLTPRLIGEPGLGKTTLACAAARASGQDIYIIGATMDTRPEDLVITPVLAADRRVEYRASALVSAMIRGGIAVLDEANRMPERSWASLAPLMDDRRYVESAVAAIKIAAHPDFRLCVTMNSDSSVYELPGYIQSRLKPKIEVVNPPWRIQKEIVRAKSPGVQRSLLNRALTLLKRRLDEGTFDSTRDMLSFVRYAQNLCESDGGATRVVVETALRRAADQVLAGGGEG